MGWMKDFVEDDFLGGALGDIWKGFTGQSSQEEINDVNAEIARENLAYQKAFNEQVFNREDTELQRRKNDAISAGFSPLAALGTGGGSAAVVSAPQQQITARSNVTGLSPFAAASALGNMISNFRDSTTNRMNAGTESRRVTDLKTFNDAMTALRASEFAQQHEHFLKQLEEMGRQFDSKIAESARQSDNYNTTQEAIASAANTARRKLAEFEYSYQNEWQKNILKQAQEQIDNQVEQFNKAHKQKNWQFVVGNVLETIRDVGLAFISGGNLGFFIGGNKRPIGFSD